ncbi:MAG: diacylglycerol kinase family protein, partial [Polyangiales bacterium]
TGEVALTDRVETKLPLVKAPTLVLRGEKDAFVSEGWIERMRRLLPRGVSASIPDAAHAAHYSRPEEVAAVVRPFLKGETTPVSLIHNPRAGKRGDESERLRAALLREGLEVRVESEDAETAMREPPRTVVVAGGDGTVARAMRAAVGRDKTLVVIPTGTANNIARALGLPLGVDAARGLGRRRCVDLGLLSGPFGMREWFVESVGVGAIADFIGTPEAKGDKRPHRARKRMQTMLSDYRGLDVDLRVDGEDLSGRYLLVEILNIPAVGPRLPLGDEVAIDDGAFRLVLATERDRDALRARLEGEPTNGPPLPTRTAKRIDLLVDGAFHVDDRVVRSRHEQLVVEVAPAAVEILQPHAH